MRYAIINEEGTEVLRYVRKSPVKDDDLAKLKTRNVLPVEEQEPTLQPWQTRGERVESIEADKVVVSYQVNDMTLNQYKAQAVRSLHRDTQNQVFLNTNEVETIPFIYTALPQARRTALEQEGAAIVEEVMSKRRAINNATTHQEVSNIYAGLTYYLAPEDIDENGFPIK